MYVSCSAEKEMQMTVLILSDVKSREFIYGVSHNAEQSCILEVVMVSIPQDFKFMHVCFISFSFHDGHGLRRRRRHLHHHRYIIKCCLFARMSYLQTITQQLPIHAYHDPAHPIHHHQWQ